MKRIAASLILAISSIAALAQATIPVSGTRVYDSSHNLLTGQLVFTVTDSSNNPVTYTVQGGSPSTATITIPTVGGILQNVGGFPPQIPNPSTMSPADTRYDIQVQSTGGGTVYYDLPLTDITLSFFSYDSYSVQSGVTASGLGRPRIPCSPGALYNDTTATNVHPWACSALASGGSVYWTQNPSENPSCPGISQAAVSPIVGTTFCTDSTNAYATPGLIMGSPSTPGSAPGPLALVPVPTQTAPTGQQYRIGAYNGSTSDPSHTPLGSSNSTTDATGNQLNSPIVNGAYQAFSNQTGSGNNGIANAFSAGAKWVYAGPLYPNTESRAFGPSGTRMVDQRGGHQVIGCLDPILSDGVETCDMENFASVTRYNPKAAESAMQHLHNTFIGGYGNSDDAGGALFNGQGADGGNMWSFTPGIGSTHATTLQCAHDEDCIINYKYLNYGFDCHSFGTECTKYNAVDTTEYPYLVETTVGTVTDQTHLVLNGITGGSTSTGAILGGGTVLIDKSDLLDSGTATADTSSVGSGLPDTITTATTHAGLVTTSYGTTTAIIPQATSVPLGSATTVTVTNLGAAFPTASAWSSSTTYASGNMVTYLGATYQSTTSSNLNNAPIAGSAQNSNWLGLDVCVVGAHWEEAPFTAAAASGSTQDLTLINRYSNGTNTFVALGKCRVAQLPIEKQTAPGTGYVRSAPYYIVPGAPDSTHYWYNASHGDMFRQNLTPAAIFPVLSFDGNVSRNGTTATGLLDESFSGAAWIQGASSMTLSGCSDSSYNKTNASLSPTITSVQGGGIQVTWNDTGASGSTAGCSLQVTGRSDFQIYDAAEIVNVTDPAVAPLDTASSNDLPAIDGYVQLGYNQIAWSGKTVEQPHGEKLSLQDTVQSIQNSPSTNAGGDHAYIGWGFTGPGFRPHRDIWYNQDVGAGNLIDLTQFEGNGGTRPITPIYTEIGQNAIETYYSIDTAPANGGTVFGVGCPMQGCSNSTLYYNFNNQGNGEGSFFGYTPSTNSYAISTNSFSIINGGTFHALDTYINGKFNVVAAGPSGYTPGVGFYNQDPSIGGTLQNQLNLCTPFVSAPSAVCFGTTHYTSAQANVSAEGEVHDGIHISSKYDLAPVHQTGENYTYEFPVGTQVGATGSTIYVYNLVPKDGTTGLLGPYSQYLGTAWQFNNGPATLTTSNYFSFSCPTTMENNWPTGTTFEVIRWVGPSAYDVGNCPLGGTLLDQGTVTTPVTNITPFFNNGADHSGTYDIAFGGGFGALGPTATTPDTWLFRISANEWGMGSVRGTPDGTLKLATMNATTYQVGGTALASTNLSDSSSLARVADITQGSATLTAGTVTVSTSKAVAVAGGHYMLTNCGVGGTVGILSVGSVSSGTNFVINSSSVTDTSTVCWWIR